VDIGAYEAKTRWSELLRRVARGERITVTRHGVPVAVMQPPEAAPAGDVRGAVAEVRRFREAFRSARAPVKVAELREWIEEGRR
jgi:prevent-host-death family protein